MSHVLRRLPYSDVPTEVAFLNETIPIRAYQIIVWVSVSIAEADTWDARTPRFPAILDIGHSHNFSIQEEHLQRWAGIQPDLLPVVGKIREGSRTVPLRSATLWLHPNRRGTRDATSGDTVLLQAPRGIAVYPSGLEFPRLPLLGLRAITASQIVLTIDGARKEVSARIARWRLW